MSPSAWAFAIYWSVPVLARDFGALVRCGRISEDAARLGDDTPAGWFRLAARAYPMTDAEGALARRACLLVAHRFASEVSS